MAKHLSVLFFVLLSLATSCTRGPDLKAHGDLDKRVNEYYASEKNHDWAKAYQFRTPAFRELVPLQRYVDIMRQDSAGWELIGFAVLGAMEQKGKVHAEVEFKERVPLAFFPERFREKMSGSSPVLVERSDTSIWTKINGEWFVYDPGSRTHFRMNAPLVAE